MRPQLPAARQRMRRGKETPAADPAWPGATPHPEKTDERYCLYDERHKDYGYTQAYVAKLVRECRTEAGFRKLLGTAPRDKETGDWVGAPPSNAIPPWSRTAAAAAPPEDVNEAEEGDAVRGAA